MSATDIRPLAYGPADAAKVLVVSRARVYELMNDGTIPSLKLGARRLIRHEAIADLLDRLEQKGGDDAA
jgi:excisionase family DNA binding protein